MGKTINSTFVTLDGVVNYMDQWHFDFADDEAQAYALEQLKESESLLMGRKTYDVYAATWPGRDGEYADLINAMPKYVVSSTMKDAGWENTTVISDNLLAEVDKLRSSGGPIMMHGYGPVAKTLLASGMLDELHLWFHPSVAGLGDENDRLHTSGVQAHLDHLGTKQLGSGLVILSYRSKASAA